MRARSILLKRWSEGWRSDRNPFVMAGDPFHGNGAGGRLLRGQFGSWGGLCCVRAGMKGDETFRHKENLPEVQAVKPCDGWLGIEIVLELTKQRSNPYCFFLDWRSFCLVEGRAGRPLLWVARALESGGGG